MCGASLPGQFCDGRWSGSCGGMREVGIFGCPWVLAQPRENGGVRRKGPTPAPAALPVCISRPQLPLSFSPSQGIFLVYDISSERSYQHIMKWVSDVDEVGDAGSWQGGGGKARVRREE